MGNAIAALTDYGSVLKTIWPQPDVEDLFFTNMPLFAMMPKDTSWTGLNRIIALQYSQTNGRSAKFANAKANKKASKFSNMNITTADNFSLFSVDHKLLTLSRNDKGSIVQALTRESRSAMKKLKRMIGAALWGNGGGAVGKIAAIAGSTITLNDPRTARFIEVDDTIDIASDDGTGGAGIRAGTPLVVTGVNRATEGATAGVITFSAGVVASIAGAIVGDFLFIDGDYNGWITGVPAYVPSFDPGTNGVPAALWGMTRTADVRRQGGVRVAGQGLLVEEAVKKALKEGLNEDCDTSHIFMNPDNFLDLELSLETRKRYVDTKVGNVGFTGLEFTSHGGKPVEVYADPDCPFNSVYGLEMDTWTFASAGEFPDFLTLSGQPNLRPEESTNSFEGRVGGYSQAYTDAPGHNWVCTLG